MSTPILRLVVGLHLGVLRLARSTSERGQSTAEYALVLAAIAGLVAFLFTKTDVFESIFNKAVAALNKAIK